MTVSPRRTSSYKIKIGLHLPSERESRNRHKKARNATNLARCSCSGECPAMLMPLGFSFQCNLVRLERAPFVASLGRHALRDAWMRGWRHRKPNERHVSFLLSDSSHTTTPPPAEHGNVTPDTHACRRGRGLAETLVRTQRAQDPFRALQKVIVAYTSPRTENCRVYICRYVSTRYARH